MARVEITYKDGNMVVKAGDLAVVAIPYADADDTLLVGDGQDDRDGEALSPLLPGTRVEAGQQHIFATGEGVRFVVEEIEEIEEPAGE